MTKTHKAFKLETALTITLSFYMITLKDVAKKANVSIKTVSRVVNNEPNGVSDKTREHVIGIIRELGYVPNMAAKRLKSGKSKTIALVLPRVTSPYAVRLLSSILSASREVNYSVLLVDENPVERESLTQIKNLIHNEQADGLIIAPPGGDHPDLIAFVKKNNIPHVIITPRKLEPDHVSVEATDREGTHEATRYLFSLGHTKIAYIACPLDERFSRERLAGFQDAFEEAGKLFKPDLVYEGDNSTESGHHIAQEILQSDNRPTAFFAGNDEMAVGVMIALWQQGFHIPDDFSVIGFDDAPIAKQIFPTLTTVLQPIDEIAKFSVDSLVSNIETANIDCKHTRIPTRLVLRNSCAVAAST